MQIKTQLEKLLNEEMDRKAFLKYTGTVVLGMIGVTGLLKNILGHRALPAQPTAAKKSTGYGASKFGQ